MIIAAREAGDLYDQDHRTSSDTTLADLAISRDLAAYAVRLGQIPDGAWARWHEDVPEPSQIAVDGEARHYLGSESSGYERRRQQLSSEWYTPALIAESARRVLGTIDLDPASSEQANLTIKAARFYSKAEDGLSRRWKGRVWLNPPYQGQTGAFITRLAESHVNGDGPPAIALVSALTTDTGHFRLLWGSLLCFVYGRIQFAGGGGTS